MTNGSHGKKCKKGRLFWLAPANGIFKRSPLHGILGACGFNPRHTFLEINPTEEWNLLPSKKIQNIELLIRKSSQE